MSNVQQYKCFACGGALTFDPKTQKLKCPFCDNVYELKTVEAYDKQLESKDQEKMEWSTPKQETWDQDSDQVKFYGCKSCGGELIVDSTTTATSCPYCDNPVVVMDNLKSNFKPELIIPFQLDKETAKSNFHKHLVKKRFLPKVFKERNHIDEIKGIYVPFWIFDADATISYRYDAKKIEQSSDDSSDYVKEKYYSIIRDGELRFEAVPVDGSSQVEDKVMESIEPFDLKAAQQFTTAYLVGYFADKYDVSAQDSIEHANQRIKRSIESEINKTLKDYDETTLKSSNIDLKNSKARFVLYPVWFLNTTWQNQKYLFAMNGQTGKFVGDLPFDKSLYWPYLLSRALVAAIIFYAIGYLIF